jgi:chromosome condensin MukBEF ATPase and DNA-binding subunit MukB
LGDCFRAYRRRDNTHSTAMAHAIYELRCDYSLLHNILAQKWSNARDAGLAHQARNRGRRNTFYYAVCYAMLCRSAIAGGLRVGLLVVSV